MGKVKTHKFRLGKYHIEETEYIEGLCDIPDRYDRLHMIILDGDTQKTLTSTIHEAMHAEGVREKLLDYEKDSAENIARFLWRLGWRRKK